jgi:hypothetical protein
LALPLPLHLAPPAAAAQEQERRLGAVGRTENVAVVPDATAIDKLIGGDNNRRGIEGMICD